MFDSRFPVVDWCGGVIPIEMDCLINCLFRSKQYAVKVIAGTLRWEWDEHLDKLGDIVAFQIIIDDPVGVPISRCGVKFDSKYPLIKWTGGDNPAGNNHLVRYRLRGGGIREHYARHLDWRHNGHAMDILEYQIVLNEKNISADDDLDEIADSLEPTFGPEPKPKPDLPNFRCTQVELPDADDTEKVCEQVTVLELWNLMCELYPMEAEVIANNMGSARAVTDLLGGKIEWSGEGLPPIGVRVDYSIGNKGWCECIIIAVTDNTVFYRQTSNGNEVARDKENVQFRPTQKDPVVILQQEHCKHMDLFQAEDILKFIEHGGVPGYGKVES